MASQTAIINLTLLHLGEDHVLSIDEQTKAAVRLKEVWQDLVDDVLSEHDWTFALKRAALARLAAAPPWGFAYAYQLPADYLKLPQTEEEEDNPWKAKAWRKEGKTILTDEIAVQLLYVARVGPEMFSAKFATTFSYCLAATVAFDLTQNVGLGKKLFDLYLLKLNDVKHQDSQERRKVVKTSAWKTARG